MIVLIVSDDERLRPFGPVIEYNGRDAFEFGACGTVVAVSWEAAAQAAPLINHSPPNPLRLLRHYPLDQAAVPPQ